MTMRVSNARRLAQRRSILDLCAMLALPDAPELRTFAAEQLALQAPPMPLMERRMSEDVLIAEQAEREYEEYMTNRTYGIELPLSERRFPFVDAIADDKLRWWNPLSWKLRTASRRIFRSLSDAFECVPPRERSLDELAYLAEFVAKLLQCLPAGWRPRVERRFTDIGLEVWIQYWRVYVEHNPVASLQELLLHHNSEIQFVRTASLRCHCMLFDSLYSRKDLGERIAAAWEACDLSTHLYNFPLALRSDEERALMLRFNCILLQRLSSLPPEAADEFDLERKRIPHDVETIRAVSHGPEVRREYQLFICRQQNSGT